MVPQQHAEHRYYMQGWPLLPPAAYPRARRLRAWRIQPRSILASARKTGTAQESSALGSQVEFSIHTGRRTQVRAEARAHGRTGAAAQLILGAGPARPAGRSPASALAHQTPPACDHASLHLLFHVQLRQREGAARDRVAGRAKKGVLTSSLVFLFSSCDSLSWMALIFTLQWREQLVLRWYRQHSAKGRRGAPFSHPHPCPTPAPPRPPPTSSSTPALTAVRGPHAPMPAPPPAA